MSWLKRARRWFREGTSKLNWSYDTNKNAPPTFVPEIIRGKTWNVNDLDHLDKVARKDPLANFIVYGVAEMVFDDGFKFVDKNGEDIMEDVLEELKILNANKAFRQCLAAERNFGYAYQYTGPNRYIPQTREGGKIASLHCFTPQECAVFEYDDIGNAKTYKIEIDVGKAGNVVGETLYLPAKDFILWNTRPIGRGDTGRSILEPIWDMLIYIQYLFHSMTFYDIKIGHGLFTAYLNTGFDSESIAKWQAAFEDISIKRAMVLDSGEVDRLEFVGPTSNATDFVEHIDMCIKTVSVATGLPKDLLMGAAAGAVTGSETNIKLGDELERKVKGAIEEYIRETILRMGYSREDYWFKWIEKTSHTEEQRAKIEQTHAQAMTTMLTYMTIDEVRALDKLPPLPDGRGDKLASEQAAFNIDVQGLQTPDEEKKTSNPQGAQI